MYFWLRCILFSVPYLCVLWCIHVCLSVLLKQGLGYGSTLGQTLVYLVATIGDGHFFNTITVCCLSFFMIIFNPYPAKVIY